MGSGVLVSMREAVCLGSTPHHGEAVPVSTGVDIRKEEFPGQGEAGCQTKPEDYRGFWGPPETWPRATLGLPEDLAE